MGKENKDYVNAIAKAYIDSAKKSLKIANYFFTLLLVVSIILTITGSFSVAFYGFVFSGFYFLIIRTFWKYNLSNIDKNL